MALFFLIPLFTGLIGGYIFKKCTDEIGYLVGIFALVCLVLSLFLAPWQILLLLLILVLITTQKLLEGNEYKLKPVEDNQEKLNYSEKKDPVSSKSVTTQGKEQRKSQYISYRPTETTGEVTEGQVAGKSLGTPLTIHKISRNA